jgi:hypothetical protein
MPEEPDRLEREINEILDKIEQFPSPEQRRARAARRSLRRFGDGVSSRQRAVVRELSRISPSQLVLLSFLMILGSFVIRGIGPVGMWIMVAGIVLLFASLAVMVFGGGGRSKPRTQQWRGRTIEYRSDTLSQRLRRWFRSRKRS